MTITLSPELEAVVRREIEAGRYESAEEFFSEAAASLQERQQYFGETREEFERKLDEAIEECERGDVMTVEEVRKDMALMKTEWMAQRRLA